jgi:hypothetical protein
MPAYQPSFQITPDILRMVANISEQLRRWSPLLGNNDEALINPPARNKNTDSK